MITGKIRKYLLIPVLVITLTMASFTVLAEETVADVSETDFIQETESVSETESQENKDLGTEEINSENQDPAGLDTEENGEDTASSTESTTETGEDVNSANDQEQEDVQNEDETNVIPPEQENSPEEKTEDSSEAAQDQKTDDGTDPANAEQETTEDTKSAEAVLPEPTVEKYYFGDMDRSGNITFHAEGISVPAGIQKIKVAVWRYADKRDRIFYPLVDGVATINIKDHDYLFGTYKARLYIWDLNGGLCYFDLVTKNYPEIYASAQGVSLDINTKIGMNFTINAKDIQCPKEIKQVKALVWSEDDQSNRKWYTNFKSDGEGNYTASGSLAEHGYKEGNYQVILYVVDKAGKTKSVARTSKEISVYTNDITVKVDAEKAQVQFNLYGLYSYGLIDHVEYALWREGSAQSDLKWFTAQPGNGYFVSKVDLASYGVNGTYNVHCYATTKEGRRFYIAGKSFDVNFFSAVTTCKLKRQSYAKMNLIVSNANVNGRPADTVKIAVWSDVASVGSGNIQDDLVWYDTVKNSDGTFSCTVDRNNHLSSGKYTAHVYAYAGENSACVAGQEFSLIRTASFAGNYAAVARNCILAVETGGQVYGNARYDDFTEAYHISAAETGITIGAGQWMGANAVRLLLDIRSADPALFGQLDSYGISIDLDNLLGMPESSWNYYGGSDTVGGVFRSGDPKATAIQRVISSTAGIAVQNATVERNIAGYIAKAKALGVLDIDAQIFCANICHLGGSGAMNRIVNKTASQGLQLTMENLWAVMEQDVYDTSSNNQVGDSLYRTRHIKIIGWIYQYLN